MRYKITLKPLQPFLFGGDNTFGEIGDKENGTYIVNSRLFPQQSAILGMLKKELMIQNKLLTRKIKGEWVDKNKTEEAKEFVGSEKFDFNKKELQNFGVIKNISSIFLQKENTIIIKKANLKKFPLEKIGDNYILKNFTAKDDIFDNYESLDKTLSFKVEDIFVSKEQTLNQKKTSENSLYKKTSYLLNKGFTFGFFLECEYELNDSIVTLGADRSSFVLTVEKSNEILENKNEFLLLLGDSLITLPLNEHCDFAITSEISYKNLIGKKSSMTKNSDPKKNKQNNPFLKSDEIYFYEKGSVIINPSSQLIDNLNNKNLQQIGYNTYTIGENN
ncbi:type III-B CRISPR module-associated Cmr3 family protein [Aliarcobacter butzleri]|uniref:type III-B CRISPR module-associated Cmr3 family protein n=1 Tax=Aliarcobacter butzleri TaxID=28197 RepID=UPI0021B42814|nr:type III-B CRISPR module-associated Cmr3 family protein [Aliarcobacter butzleri]MCT7609853.1 hypothetical protein [Aliarcobacter butzleri]